jgi:hypothetical protein
VAWLCSFAARRTGTDAERRAANGLAERLRSGGRRAAVESTYVHPQWSLVHLVHCVLAIAGSLLAAVEPAAGFALVLVAAVSMYGDLRGRWYLLRRLFFRRASQNVIAPPLDGADERDRVILCAHYDAPLTGAVFNPWAVTGFEHLRRLWPGPLSPLAIVFWAIALLLPPLGLRMAGIEADWVATLQLPQTLTLIVAAFLLGEIALSPTGPGANDNASGVAAVLAADARLGAERPDRVDVHVVLCGGGESTREGARAFLRAHRSELPRDRTWFVELDSAGRGAPRFVRREVPVIAQPLDPGLLELCAALADGDPTRSALDVAPAGAASLAASYGYPAIALTARERDEFVPSGVHSPADVPDGVDAEAIAAVAALAEELVRLLDRDRARTG